MKESVYPNKSRTLSIKVIERYMSPETLEKLLKDYKINSYRHTNTREAILKMPLTKEDIALIRFYVTETEIPTREYEDKHNLPRGSSYGRVCRLAVRLLAQNPKLLDLAEKKLENEDTQSEQTED